MASRREKQGMPVRFPTVAWVLPLILAGCASTPPALQANEQDQHAVVGTSVNDRDVIETSSQHVFNAEHADNPLPAVTPDPEMNTAAPVSPVSAASPATAAPESSATNSP